MRKGKRWRSRHEKVRDRAEDEKRYEMEEKTRKHKR